MARCVRCDWGGGRRVRCGHERPHRLVRRRVARRAQDRAREERDPHGGKGLERVRAAPAAPPEDRGGEHGHPIKRQLVEELRVILQRRVEGHRADAHERGEAKKDEHPERGWTFRWVGANPVVVHRAHQRVERARDDVERLGDVLAVEVVRLAPVKVAGRRAPDAGSADDRRRLQILGRAQRVQHERHREEPGEGQDDAEHHR